MCPNRPLIGHSLLFLLNAVWSVSVSVCEWVWECESVWVCECVSVRECVCECECECACLWVCVRVWECVSVWVCESVWESVCVCECECECECACVWVCVCVCVSVCWRNTCRPLVPAFGTSPCSWPCPLAQISNHKFTNASLCIFWRCQEIRGNIHIVMRSPLSCEPLRCQVLDCVFVLSVPNVLLHYTRSRNLKSVILCGYWSKCDFHTAQTILCL